MKSLFVRIYRSIPLIRELIQIRIALNRIFHLLQAGHAIDSTRLFDLELPSNPRYADHKRLLRFAFQASSQHREDGMIAEIFKRIGTQDKNFLEIGVGDGIENNTSFLLSQGWKGFWIDADDSFSRQLKNKANEASALRWLITKVSKENINELLEKLNVPEEFDLLSLDIDQNTYYVWEGMSAFRPRVVVIEYNATMTPDLNWKVNYDAQRVWDHSANFGGSLKAFELLGRTRGYSLVGCDFSGTNAFFVRNDLISTGSFCEPFTAENHYEPRRYALMLAEGHARAIMDKPSN